MPSTCLRQTDGRSPLATTTRLLSAVLFLLSTATANAAGNPGQVRAWVQLLNSDDVQQRSFAANALLATGDEYALKALRTALSPKRRDAVRVTIIKAFAFAGSDKATDLLIESLDDKSEAVRQAAADALAKIKTPAAVELLKAAATDTKASVRARTQVIGILGGMRELGAVETLIKLLGDPDAQIAKSARAALQLITYRTFETSFEWGNWWEQARKMNRVQLLEDQVQRQAEQLQKTQKLVAKLYLKLIAGRKDKNDPTLLIEALQESGSEEVQLYALDQLTRITPENKKIHDQITTALAKGLQEESFRVRAKAAESLGARNDVRVIPSLVEALEDGVPSVRAAAAKSLGELGPRAVAAVDTLNKLLGDKDASVASAAAMALGQVGDPKAIQPLIKLLRRHANTPESPVYEAAGQALANIEGPAVLSVLTRELLKSPSVKVRYAATGALGTHGKRDPKTVMSHLARVVREEPNPQIRSRAVTALAETGHRAAIAPLLDALSDKDKAVGEQAFASLMVLCKGKKDWFSDAIERLLKKKQYDLAEHILENAAEQFKVMPNHAKATAELRNEVAQALVAAGEWKRAKPHLVKLYTSDKKNPAFLQSLVSCSMALKEYDALEVLLEQARKDMPGKKPVLWEETVKLAQARFDAGQYQAVLTFVDKLLREDRTLGGPGSALALRELREKAAAKLAPPPAAKKPEPKKP